MGAQSPASTAIATALCSQQPPSVSVESAADDGEADGRVIIEGTMYHDGLNRNYWGLTQEGAQKIADSLKGRDFTASHPFIRNGVYDRAIAGGQGMPVGTVIETDVTTVDSASALDGGQYTATYKVAVEEPAFASRYQRGTYTQEGYGVSIGIYGNPKSATCSACGEQMSTDDCSHSRGETVEASDDGEEKVAGPLYDDGISDHLAAVYMPAYPDADDTSVSNASQQSPQPASPAAVADTTDEPQAATELPLRASTVLAEPFDAAGDAETATETDTDDDHDRSRGPLVSVDEDAAINVHITR
jgi:hypothetical protein